jgi:hypothetical protein
VFLRESGSSVSFNPGKRLKGGGKHGRYVRSQVVDLLSKLSEIGACFSLLLGHCLSKRCGLGRNGSKNLEDLVVPPKEIV